MKFPDDAAMVLFRGIDRVVEELPRIVEMAQNEERAAVVAWLRRETYPCCGQCNNELATYIERGEHRREGER